MDNNNIETLYIFVTSDTPDLYINIIGYCIEHYPIKKIVFLGLLEDRGQKKSVEESLKRTKERVSQQLDLLQEGKYLYKDQNTRQWQQKSIVIEKHHKIRYARIAQQSIDIHAAIYETLGDDLTTFLASSGCIFDVSGVHKDLLIDVNTLLLQKDMFDIYVFKLMRPFRTYDEQELIHNLYIDKKDYEYVNVNKSRYTEGTIVKSKIEEDKDKQLLASVESFIKRLADQFARNTLTIYLLIFIAIFTWTMRFSTQQGGWDKLEPWTFLLIILLPYLISLVTQIFFNKELSIKPSVLQRWLRDYKVKSLRNKFRERKSS
ncbi:MAG: hypothetical protein D3910_14965 [Candidatus Electrothrix sp. ATG2]|nr:hypothetical protein [Candidatus Electrothrix sp. ATG2]